jgi:hypothetical protein
MIVRFLEWLLAKVKPKPPLSLSPCLDRLEPMLQQLEICVFVIETRDDIAYDHKLQLLDWARKSNFALSNFHNAIKDFKVER